VQRGVVPSNNTSRKSSCLQVTPAEFTGHKEVVGLDRARLEDGRVEINFEFRKQRYCYDPAGHSFERLHFPDKVTFLCHWDSTPPPPPPTVHSCIHRITVSGSLSLGDRNVTKLGLEIHGGM